jgi:hypothetical protein
MKKILLAASIAALALLSSSAAHAQITLDFVANKGATLQFNGATKSSLPSFQFDSDTDGYQFNITDEQGGTGVALGLDGSIIPSLGSVFTYGPITTYHVTPTIEVQTAPVTPTGTISISDGGTHDLTGTVNFGTITTVSSGGGLNTTDLDVNLTDLSYSGTNVDLKELVADQPGVLDISFQFGHAEDLTALSELTTSLMTSFSGTIEEVPEPSTWAMLIGGMGVLLVGMRFRRIARQS